MDSSSPVDPLLIVLFQEGSSFQWYGPLSRVFPGLSLKPHHINPALISDNFLGPLGREPEITGEEEDDVPISNIQGEGISDSFNDKQRLLIGSNIGSNSDRTFTDTGIRVWN